MSCVEDLRAEQESIGNSPLIVRKNKIKLQKIRITS